MKGSYKIAAFFYSRIIIIEILERIMTTTLIEVW